MAKPRLFVSSTFYDLKHIRSSLDIFIERFRRKVISPTARIAPWTNHVTGEVQTADLLVLIVGGRSGSEASGTERKPSPQFCERYETLRKKNTKAQ